MERMFPEPKEFVKVDSYVIKDFKAPYNRYWNTEQNKWTGLLSATKFTKEAAESFDLPDNGVVLNYDDVLKQ